MKRKETYEALLGQTRYLSDVELPGMLHAAILRSPWAHARIKGVDLSAALACEGVVAAFSGLDVKSGSKPLAPFPFTALRPYSSEYPRMRFAEHHALATDKVRYVGEAVAVVVATDRYTATDALDKIDVAYEPLPVLVDAEQGLRADAPRIYEEWPDNLQYEFRFSEGPVDDLLARSHLVVKEQFKLHRYTGTPLEGRGVIADFDGVRNKLTVYDSTQIPHSMANLVLESLGRPDVQIRVICPRIGGGFGIKWAFYPEEVLIPWLSMQCGRPVAWWETRTEHLLASHHSRQQAIELEAGFDANGTITALKASIVVDLGAAYPSGGTSLAFVTANFIPGAYHIENFEVRSLGIVTNKTPSGPLRANGKVESNYVMERLLDRAARKLGIARDEIRLRNFVPAEAFPYTNVTGSIYDSGDYHACLRKALALADYPALLKDQASTRRGGKLRGIGIGFMMEPLSSLRPNAYNAGYETATVRLDPTGKAWVLSGDINMGQAHQTTLSQVVADELGIGFDQVEVQEGDTGLISSASGSYASRYSTVTLSAAIMASRAVREKVMRIAARMLECSEKDLALEGGMIRPVGQATRGVSVKEVANVAYYAINRLPEGMEPGLHATHYFINPNTRFGADEKGRSANFSTFPYAAHVAYVEVDAATGEFRILKYLTVDDAGVQVNPMIVRTQIMGGIAHGLGGAVLEELVYDADGQLQNTNFATYLIPSIVEMPNLELHHTVTPMPFTPGGFKGTGEIGAIGPTLTLASALEDALAPLGVGIDRLPLKPENVWRDIQRARNAPVADR